MIASARLTCIRLSRNPVRQNPLRRWFQFPVMSCLLRLAVAQFVALRLLPLGAFVVSGLELYEINSDGTGTLRGTLSTATSRVSMAENGTQLMIVDGQYGYIYNMDTNVFAQITDSDFPVCATVTYQDGYFIVPETGTPNFYISALYNGLSWDALDFSNAMANPDNLVSVTSDNGMLWMHGDISTEVFQNTGAAAFPFERVPGAIINSGCADAQTIIALIIRCFGLALIALAVAWCGVRKGCLSCASQPMRLSK